MVRRSLTLSALVLVAVLAVGATSLVAQPLKPLDKQPEVPYVPTNEKIVAEMLKVANVGKNDVLYDLGCGDGRIPITAAKRFGTRGVGVDIDPERITEARDNATKAGVADKVKFMQQDLFDTDIKEATVVTLYLLPEVNMRLRPKLLADLKPGTRVVSHNYDMGDWKPLKTLTVKLPDGDHTVYYWVVPPRAAGK
jgi:ribosomal protein L11 methylase PrmA